MFSKYINTKYKYNSAFLTWGINVCKVDGYMVKKEMDPEAAVNAL